METHGTPVYFRKAIELEDFQTFRLSAKSFDRQFSCIYVARLKTLKEHVLQKAKAKWGEYQVVKVSDLVEENNNELCIIVGTLYKHQELKPSILRDLSEELQITPQPARTNYALFKDLLFLEDEMLRIQLVGKHMNIQDVVTGLVCAVLGRNVENDKFLVTDWCFPGCPKSLIVGEPSRREGRILLISGLDLIHNAQSLGLNLLSEWICGMCGDKNSQKEAASVICVIIAGNSVRGSVETYNRKSYFENKAQDEAIFKEAAMSVHRLDNFLQPLVQCCSVILMPGEFDPVCHTIPQQSFHPCILPQSARFKSFHGVTNPWIGSINSRIIAGSSGQPIIDIMKVAGLADVSPLTWLERTLHWRHFAPTAPDTLSAYPYFNIDPFIMTKCPAVYFVGNMEEYDTKLMTADDDQTIRLICIPKFSKTQMGVLVDMQDLRTWPVSFGVG